MVLALALLLSLRCHHDTHAVVATSVTNKPEWCAETRSGVPGMVPAGAVDYVKARDHLDTSFDGATEDRVVLAAAPWASSRLVASAAATVLSEYAGSPTVVVEFTDDAVVSSGADGLLARLSVGQGECH